MMVHQVNMHLPSGKFGNARQNKIGGQQAAADWQSKFINFRHINFHPEQHPCLN